MRQNIQGANQGCFLLMVGIYFFAKGKVKVNSGDEQSGFTYYTEAYKVFENLRDELFMLLTSRLLVEFCKTRGINNEHLRVYQSIYDQIRKMPTFREVNLDLLFENFDQRLTLAKKVVSVY